MSAERLAELIRDRQPCVVLTGAGVALAIVNKGSTTYDAQADLKVDASGAETLSAVAAMLLRA